MDALNIKRPTVCPKATDNIPEMIAIVQALLDKGYAYQTEDGIYEIIVGASCKDVKLKSKIKTGVKL